MTALIYIIPTDGEPNILQTKPFPNINDIHPAINRSEIARALGVSRGFLHQVKLGRCKLTEQHQAKLDELCRAICDSLR